MILPIFFESGKKIDLDPLLELPSESISLVTGGVVLPGNTHGEDSARGKDVVIVIASLTLH
jgi:hypothetical protein